MCWPPYTSHLQRHEQCVKKGGRAGWRNGAIHHDESGRQRGRFSEAEAHLGGVMSAWVIIFDYKHTESMKRMISAQDLVLDKQC